MTTQQLHLEKKAPAFRAKGISKGEEKTYSLDDFAGQWLVLFFYPADFTFVCPTEIVGFERKLKEFSKLNTALVGVSVDSLEMHKQWAEELGGLSFPLLSDEGRTMCQDFGVLSEADKRAFRATFIISPEGKITYMVVSPMNVGRSVDETLRVLTALQTGRLCPADWRPGEPTIDSSRSLW